VLVTGASGFIGSALLRRMLGDGWAPRAALRRSTSEVPAGVTIVPAAPLETDFDWHPAVAGCEAVVHTAARVHMLSDPSRSPLAEFRRVNVDGAVRLARQAAAAGVRRFVFLSSIKVNGEVTRPGQPFTPEDTPAPLDSYGTSKHEAEVALRGIGTEMGMEIVIVRPVLVYGPGVKANFRAMLRWLERGRPLPLGAIHNRRSLVGLDNLVDLLTVCVRHPAAANETFLVSDGEDLSTTELLRRAADALGRRARLIPVPEQLLRMTATLAGKGDLARRLLGSLQVDIRKTRTVLGWTPLVSVDAGLRSTAAWFLTHQNDAA
jgi:nucleoside-diphosphate-sugar epimerase